MTPDIWVTTRRQREKKGGDNKWDRKRKEKNLGKTVKVAPGNFSESYPPARFVGTKSLVLTRWENDCEKQTMLLGVLIPVDENGCKKQTIFWVKILSWTASSLRKNSRKVILRSTPICRRRRLKEKSYTKYIYIHIFPAEKRYNIRVLVRLALDRRWFCSVWGVDRWWSGICELLGVMYAAPCVARKGL